jgi:hypothetical protein
MSYLGDGMYAKRRHSHLSGLIALVILLSVFSGCLDTKNTDMRTVGANLDTLGFTLENTPSGYHKEEEKYVSEPYVEIIGFWEGYTLLETYNVIYNNHNNSSMMLYLVRFESTEKCRSALEPARKSMPSFTELHVEHFGEESHIYEVSAESNEDGIIYHMILFIVADVLVQINTINFARGQLFEYAHIIEDNVNSTVQ